MRDISWGGAKPKVTYWRAVLNLIGHLLGTAILFAVFLCLAWGISWFAYWLNNIHPLPSDILMVVNQCELGITYADAVLCVILIATGAIEFIRELRGL